MEQYFQEEIWLALETVPQATSHLEHEHDHYSNTELFADLPARQRSAEEQLTLILRDFFSSLMTVSLSSSLSPSPSASVISARRAAARRSAGGVGCNGDQRNKTQNWYLKKNSSNCRCDDTARGGPFLASLHSAGNCCTSPALYPAIAPRRVSCQGRQQQDCGRLQSSSDAPALPKTPAAVEAHLGLWPICIIFSLLHSRGHLVHGRDEDAAGLTQTLVGVDALGAVDLQKMGRKWQVPLG